MSSSINLAISKMVALDGQCVGSRIALADDGSLNEQVRFLRAVGELAQSGRKGRLVLALPSSAEWKTEALAVLPRHLVPSVVLEVPVAQLVHAPAVAALCRLRRSTGIGVALLGACGDEDHVAKLICKLEPDVVVLNAESTGAMLSTLDRSAVFDIGEALGVTGGFLAVACDTADGTIEWFLRAGVDWFLRESYVVRVPVPAFANAASATLTGLCGGQPDMGLSASGLTPG